MALDAISSLVVCLSVLPTPARAAASSPEALYALNNLQTFGAGGTEYGRFFDAGAHRAWKVNLEAITMEGITAPAAPLIKRSSAPIPFILDVPTVPPAPFQHTFNRLLGRRETNGYDELIYSYAARQGLVLAQVGHPVYEVPLGPTIPAYYGLVASRYMHEFGSTEPVRAPI